jgi:cytochrome c553
MRTGSILVLVLLVAGCPSEPHPVATTRVDIVQSVALRMHDRYAWATQIVHGIASGDFALARASARVITKLDEPDAPATWQPFLASVHDGARQIEIAPDTERATHAAATMGQRCAECHQAFAVSVRFPIRPPPPQTPRLASEMLDHQWAAALMWDGLIGPDPELWARGAKALETVPLNIVARAITPAYQGDVDDVARVRALAKRATTMTTTPARAALFGDLLETCAHCHAIIRGD